MSKSLSEAQIRSIFKMHQTGEYLQQQIADEFQVSRSYISMILSGTRRSKVVFPEGVFKTFKVDGALYAVYDNGTVWGARNRKFLRPADNGNGYLKLNLGPNGSARYVHHLVLRAFHGKRPEGTEACHNNGNSLDNSSHNLRWGTRSANNKDKQRHKTALNGEKNHQHVIPDKLMGHLLFAWLHSGMSKWDFSVDMESRLGISRNTLNSALRREHFNEGVLDKWNSKHHRKFLPRT